MANSQENKISPSGFLGQFKIWSDLSTIGNEAIRGKEAKFENETHNDAFFAVSKALFIWSGLPHLGGMFLSFRSYDIFIPLRWAGFLLKMTFRLMWFFISVLSHSRLRSNPKSISLEWDSPLNCLHMRNYEKYLSHLSGISPVLKWDLTSVGSYESNHLTI